jgi:hypothetical protein
VVAAPQETPDGTNRPHRIGGEGTPEVSELCFAELAIARGAGVIATENDVASVLDLKHRMPLLWAAVQRLEVDAWVARRIAKDARRLDRDRVGLVDTAVAAAVGEAPGRLLAIAEAKIIEADPDLHRARLEEDALRTGVWLSKVRPGEIIDELAGEPATRRISAKLATGTAIRCDETVEDLAQAIFDNTPPDAAGDRHSHAECRLAAFEMLTTDPHRAAAFLDEYATGQPTEDPDPEPAPKRKRKPAKIVVHLTDRVLCGHVAGQDTGVARVEGMGPMLLDQLSDLLEGRELIVQPVIDLNTTVSVNGYEHPTAVKERTLLRTLGDVFPTPRAVGWSGSTTTTRRPTTPTVRPARPATTTTHP